MVAINSMLEVGDYYSTYRNYTLVGLDNDSTLYDGCSNDVTAINAGKTQKYFYAHFRRPMLSSDYRCDSDVQKGWTDLCLVWKFVNSNEKDFSSHHDGIWCNTFSDS